MANNTIITTRQITLDSDADAARQRMTQAITRRKGKIAEDHEDQGSIVAKFGSQLPMRLIGGWLVPSSTLPVKATITLTPHDAGTAVLIEAADAMGVGIKSGMNVKFTDAVNEVADVLANA